MPFNLICRSGRNRKRIYPYFGFFLPAGRFSLGVRILLTGLGDLIMYLLVGLGNPGAEYLQTRHNIGFQFLDYLAARYGFAFGESKWRALLAKTILWQENVLCLKPQTFMNLSGTAVVPAAEYYRVEVERIVVVHDDLDLPLGRIKIVTNSGAGGHNGIRSLIAQLGEKNFPRIKVGIGRPPGRMPVEKYVLSAFAAEERELRDQVLVEIAAAAELLLGKGLAAAMNAVNVRPEK